MANSPQAGADMLSWHNLSGPHGGGQGNVAGSFLSMGIVTVNGSQAIAGYWRTSAATATNTTRQLFILCIA
jgi:hypothetical protein